jgi:hypothetical protein
MMIETARLVGTWLKAESPPCAALYPALLKLESNGLYRGFTDPPGQFATWDVGTWMAHDHGQIAISTANDAVVTYTFALFAESLTFTDPVGCRFTYHRSS